MSVAMWNCQSWELDVTTGGEYVTAYLGTSYHISSLSHYLTSYGGYIWQPIWVLHLTSDLGHFIWQVVGGRSDSLSGYFISHLILVTSGDKLWGVYLSTFIWELDCFEWTLIDNIDQWELSSWHWQFCMGVYLSTSSENLTVLNGLSLTT